MQDSVIASSQKDKKVLRRTRTRKIILGSPQRAAAIESKENLLLSPPAAPQKQAIIAEGRQSNLCRPFV